MGKRSGVDGPTLVAGMVVALLGVVVLLDRAGVVDFGFAVLAPIACAVLGAILLVLGLSRSA